MPARSTPGHTSTQIALKDAVRLFELGFGLSSTELASILGIDSRMLERWASCNTVPPNTPPETRKILLALLGILGRLVELFETTADMRAWMHRPLPFLGQMAPIDAVKVGRIESVDAALEAIDEGFAS
jgi:uncharacterized protein (DUF2384 family)